MAFEARELQTIINNMVTDIQARTDLYDVTDSDETKLSNPSNASIWYNILGLFATAISILESEMEDLETDLNDRAKEIPVGILRWYAAETLNYQYGDTLILSNGVPVYAVDDDTLKVVDLSSAIEQEGNVIIKAAKLVSGVAEPLSALELSGLTEYWISKRFAGTPLTVLSLDADVIQIYATIEVDGQLISSTGESLTTPGTYPVEDAINEYIANLDFNGRYLVMSNIDAIQSVNGVNNVVFTQVLAKADGATSYVDVTAAQFKDYTAVAGYIKEDTSAVFRDTITYIV